MPPEMSDPSDTRLFSIPADCKPCERPFFACTHLVEELQTVRIRVPSQCLLVCREETMPPILAPRELAATSMAFENIPFGFFNTLVVPYDLSAATVQKTATVAHLSNKYCKSSEYCSGPFEGYLVS